MYRKRELFIMILVILWAGLISSIGQQSNPCMAVITEINGNALIREAGMSQYAKATWGTRLFKGDQVATDDKSEVKLLYADNNFIVLGPNSTITISGRQSDSTEPIGNVKRFKSAAIVNLSSLTLDKSEKKDIGALAGIRSVSLNPVIGLDKPFSTIINTDRPSFSWHTAQSFDKFTVNLYDSNGLVWSREVKQPGMQYPENEKGLQFGESYYWNVRGDYLIDTEKSTNHMFTLLPAEKSKEVSEYESAIRDSFREDPESSSLHSVLGAYYIDQGLLQDAISEFLIIAEQNPDASLPHEILGSLYSEAGEKDKAIEELHKALNLSNK